MSWIIDFFKSIGSLIYSVFNFVISGIVSIIKLIIMIPEYVGYLTQMIQVLPSWIIVFLVGIITISVIWTIRKAI